MRTAKDYIESQSQDPLIEHDVEECGMCFHRHLMQQVAQEMLEAQDFAEDAPGRHWDEVTKRWQQGKYYKLYQEEKAAGRDPAKAFAERGWEM